MSASGKLRSEVLPLLFLSVSLIESLLAFKTIPNLLPNNISLVGTFLRFLLGNALLYIVYRQELYPRFFSPLRHLPAPKGWPIVNHTPYALKNPPGSQLLRCMLEVPNDGLIRFRAVSSEWIILVTSPEILNEVLVGHPYDFIKSPQFAGFLGRILGDGLVITEGEIHKFQRKNVMPAFQFRHLKELYPMMWEKAVLMTECLDQDLRQQSSEHVAQKRPEGVLEINHWSNKVTMDIIGVAALGREFHALSSGNDELIAIYEEMLAPTWANMIYAVSCTAGPQDLVRSLPWSMNTHFDNNTSGLRRICTQLVKDKRDAIKADTDTTKHIDLLSILIRSNNFGDNELVDQMLTFIAAGHETTSSAFTWMTYLLAWNPSWQIRLREELRQRLPVDLKAVPRSADDLAHVLETLPILNGVCNETLRLYPTVPITARSAIRDTTLGGVFIPKGTDMRICPWAANRHPHFWSNADEFHPERWIDNFDTPSAKPNNHGGAESNYSLLTFLHGPRSCIGQNFAKQELRCIAAAFVRAFEWEMAIPGKKVNCVGAFTTKPEGGMNLRLKSLVGT